jgi:hypothetical protein
MGGGIRIATLPGVGRVASAVIGRSRRDGTEIPRRKACFVIAVSPLEAVTKPSITPLTREVLFHSSFR